MTDIKQIAERLSEAQRKALLFAPNDCDWMGRGNLGQFKQSFSAMDRVDLGRPKLTDVATDIGGVFDAQLTPLGKQVRTYLLEKADG